MSRINIKRLKGMLYQNRYPKNSSVAYRSFKRYMDNEIGKLKIRVYIRKWRFLITVYRWRSPFSADILLNVSLSIGRFVDSFGSGIELNLTLLEYNVNLNNKFGKTFRIVTGAGFKK